VEYSQLTISIYLHKDIHFTESNEHIGTAINKAMLLDKELSIKHQTNEFKFYVFNNFYPIEQDKIYRKGRIYIFKIRSLDKAFIEKIKTLITKIENLVFKVISIEEKRFRQRQITELYTITPALITVDNRHWLPQDNFMLVSERFQGGLEKKYKQFFNETLEIGGSFIQRVELLNKVPFSFKYKNTKLLANKFRIAVNEDETSQKLAFIAEATGIGEKSSAVGLGFCMADYLE
jgi:CRISPR-associated endoribonuclease Cas6